MWNSKLKKFNIPSQSRKEITDPIVVWSSWCSVVFSLYNDWNLCWIEQLNDGQWKKIIKLLKEISKDWQKNWQYNSCASTKQIRPPFSWEYAFLNNYDQQTIIEFILNTVSSSPGRLFWFFNRAWATMMFHILLITSNKHLQ